MKHIDARKRPELKMTETIRAMPVICSNELAAVEFLEAQRWGDMPCCVHCGDIDVFKFMDRKTGERNKRFLWKCRGCKKQFTVRIGTVYEESRIELRHWCFTFWMMSVSKKGVSALQIMRQTGLSYKSALFLLHRIRHAMAENHETAPQLKGTVECDEVYIGGRPRNRSAHNKRGAGTRKTPVFAMVERGGNVRAQVLAKVTAANIHAAMQQNIDIRAAIHTDEHVLYPAIAERYTGGHHTVKHGDGEYARGDVTTNGVEGFFSILKRGLNGVYHAVSREHLPRYLAEFEFRYNGRKMNDGERVVAAIRAAEGKRLFYRQPKNAA